MERFLAAYGKPVKYEEVEPSLVEKYSELPSELLQEWKENGFAVYQQGLLWFTNPDEYQAIVKTVLGEDSIYLCVARTAFGDLILFAKDNHWLYLSAYTLDTTDYQAPYHRFFDFMMSRKDWLRDVMRLNLYKKALKKLGELQAKEVYAFEPHPVVGGTGDVNTLVKRQIFEYLEMLSQFAK